MTFAPATVPTQAGTRPRIHAVDAVRGFALCGILLTNIPMIALLTRTNPDYDLLPIPYALELVAHQRFYPMFAFLFGISFALVMSSAAERSEHPRLVLLRRLLVLGALGVPHMFLAPDVLTYYAVFGLALLLPATWLPRWLVLVLGIAALIAKPDGPLANIGLLLIGYAAGRFDFQHKLERHTGQVAIVFAVALVGIAAALPWQLSEMKMSGFSASSAVAGLAVATAYATGFLLLLRTPLRPVLSAVFEPLGRMALTNYLSATLIVHATSPILGLSESRKWGVMLLLALGILVVQAVFSAWWLSHYRYGPVEWCWRCATWWRIVPNRKPAVGRPWWSRWTTNGSPS